MKCVLVKFVFSLGVISLLLFSCNHNRESTKQDTATTDTSTSVYTAAEHEALTYWDDVDMQDTANMINPTIGEQKLVDFLTALNSCSDSIADQAIAKMLDKAKLNKTSLAYFLNLYEHYLYDGNSPMRNDVRYGSVLRYLIQSDHLTDLEKEAYRPIYKLVQRNKVGQIAEDFSFERFDGKIQKLSDVKAKYTMMLFYDTECTHCKEILALLKDTPQLTDLFEKKEIQIVTIEPWGDRKKWVNYEPHLAKNWINGFDPHTVIQRERLYDTKASPTIYLLDAHKKVLLKDVELQLALQIIPQLP
ncbi:DUF5106 domain-containing protein [Sphingobacterium faecium]|uniref:DUF5106 domain-containing protein n=1 Tax=Sphingobacterium faecium TaxID=34087 RepID=UPI0012919B5A|nr:DUF5106 domain-containing protein [Sphingobacterium faecium]MQP27033.1 DUF5106 domain-containing protein [Sphingobacterium faecium]